MKTDRTTKVLLAAIAVGLWMNALAPLLQGMVRVRRTGAEVSKTSGAKLAGIVGRAGYRRSWIGVEISHSADELLQG